MTWARNCHAEPCFVHRACSHSLLHCLHCTVPHGVVLQEEALELADHLHQLQAAYDEVVEANLR